MGDDRGFLLGEQPEHGRPCPGDVGAKGAQRLQVLAEGDEARSLRQRREVAECERPHDAGAPLGETSSPVKAE